MSFRSVAYWVWVSRGRRATPVCCAVFALAGCGRHADTVFYPLSVEFEESRSEALEGSSITINVRLNGPSEQAVDVSFRVNDVTASGHDACGMRDYSLTGGLVHFEPGQTLGVIELRHLDDDVPETDEALELELYAPSGALLGHQVRHEHTIVDDDRELLVDVRRDFSARGDGLTDDTLAIQAAIDRAALSSAAVVVWPAGEYLVRGLELPAGINYFGHGATLRQAPDQAVDAQLLTLSFAGDEDSPLALVQGFELDGNRERQGEFTDWQYQESELLHAEADPMRPGRLRLVVQDVRLVNTGGNGVWLGTNTDAALCRIEGSDTFTDLVKLQGGYSKLVARDIVGDGSIGTTGVALTGEQPGYSDRRGVEVTLEDLELRTGDLEIDVQDASSVVGTRISMQQAPLYVRAVRSSVLISDSTLVVGPPRFRYNRIIAPNDVRFERSDFILTETIERTLVESEADRELVLFDVTWDDVGYAFSEEGPNQLVEMLTDQTLRFDDCDFHLAGDIEDADTVFVAGSVGRQDPNNRIVIAGSRVDPGFDGVFAPSCLVCSTEQ